MFAASHDHGGHRAGTAGDHEAGAAPEKIVAPHGEERATAGQRDRACDQARVHDEVGRDRADERLGQNGHVQAERSDPPSC